MKGEGNVRGGLLGMGIGAAVALLGMVEVIERGGSFHIEGRLALAIVSVPTLSRSAMGGEGLRMPMRDCFHSVELAGRMAVGSMNTEPIPMRH
jgi:hypothetical protein